MSDREDLAYEGRMEALHDSMELAGYCQRCGGKAWELNGTIRCVSCESELDHSEVGPKQPEYACPICRGVVCKQGNQHEIPCDDCVSAGYTAPLEWQTVKAHPSVEWLTEQVATLQDLKATLWQPPQLGCWQWSITGALPENRADWFDGDFTDAEEAAKRDADTSIRRLLATVPDVKGV